MKPAERSGLATVDVISAITPIPNADNIVAATVRGWTAVVSKDKFCVGDFCVYIEVDTMVDVTDRRFEFLADRGIRTDAEGNTGHVLKTIKLRGVYSQGLALSLSDFPEIHGVANPGRVVTAYLPVRRWNPAIPASLAGEVLGRRPSWIPVTDEERIQNVPEMLDAKTDVWVATEKIDGASTTYFWDGEKVGVCSRNLELAFNPSNTMWSNLVDYHIEELIRKNWPDSRVAIQGETFGPGIQGNPLKVNRPQFRAFTLYVDGLEVPRFDWPQVLIDIGVPVHSIRFPKSVEQALADVDSLPSLINTPHIAEGIVWRSFRDPVVYLRSGKITRGSFKAVSNRYLAKHGDA